MDMAALCLLEKNYIASAVFIKPGKIIYFENVST